MQKISNSLILKQTNGHTPCHALSSHYNTFPHVTQESPPMHPQTDLTDTSSHFYLRSAEISSHSNLSQGIPNTPSSWLLLQQAILPLQMDAQSMPTTLLFIKDSDIQGLNVGPSAGYTAINSVKKARK